MGVRKRMELQAGIGPKHRAMTETAKTGHNFPFQALLAVASLPCAT